MVSQATTSVLGSCRLDLRLSINGMARHFWRRAFDTTRLQSVNSMARQFMSGQRILYLNNGLTAICSSVNPAQNLERLFRRRSLSAGFGGEWRADSWFPIADGARQPLSPGRSPHHNR